MKRTITFIIFALITVAAVVAATIMLVPSLNEGQRVVKQYVKVVDRGDLEKLNSFFVNDDLDTELEYSDNRLNALSQSGFDMPSELADNESGCTLDGVKLIGFIEDDEDDEDDIDELIPALRGSGQYSLTALIEITYTDSDGNTVSATNEEEILVITADGETSVIVF